jgi:hypothetical protein
MIFIKFRVRLQKVKFGNNMILEKESVQIRTPEQVARTCTNSEGTVVVRTSVTKKGLNKIIKETF